MLKAVRLCLVAALLGSIVPRIAIGSLSSDQEETLARLDSLWSANERDGFRLQLDSALSNARSAADPEFTFHLLFKKGRFHAGTGLGMEAEPALREALSLAEALDEPGYQCACLRWLAVALNRQGRRGEAAGIWEQLRSLAEETGDVEHQAWAWTGLAFHDNRRGQARAALKGYERAIDLFRACNHPWGGLWALNGRGNALHSLGEYAEALDCYQHTAKAAREKGWIWLEAPAVNNVAGTLYALGDAGKARTGFQRAYELQLEDGNHAEAALAGINVSICDAELGRYEDAVANLEAIRDECVRHGIGQMEGYVRYEIANIRQREGRHHLAATLHRETLGMGGALTAPCRMESLIGLSMALTQVDSLESALDLLLAERGWSREIDDPQLRLRYRTELGRLLVESGDASQALSVLMEALSEADTLEHSGYRLAAIATAARAARSLAMPDSARAILQRGVQVWEVERRLPADPEWREVRSASAHQIYSQLGSLMLEHPPDLPRDIRARQAFDALQVFKARTLRERMLGPEGGEAPRLPPVLVTCEQLQERILGPGELLLDYYVGADGGLLFAVSREECRGVRLPPQAEIEETVSLFYKTIATREGRNLRDATEMEQRILREATLRVREVFIGSVMDLVEGCQSLVVIPDGIINLVSFRALLDAGLEERGDKVSTIQHVPSAALFSELRRRQHRAGSRLDAATRILALRGEHGERGEGLDGARREVARLQRKFHGVVTEIDLAGLSNASVPRDSMADAVLTSLDGFDILHFAAHSRADDQYPWRSRIHLDGIHGSRDGLDLFASEIAGRKLSAQLAVLSTCRSAGARILSGEGVQGLGSALLSAGVPTVIATLWAVDDRTTARLIGLFYDGLAEGRSAAEALTEAQASIRGDPRTSHPFYWGGFILIGEGASRLNFLTKRPVPRYMAPCLLAVFGIAGVLGPGLHRRWKRRRL